MSEQKLKHSQLTVLNRRKFIYLAGVGVGAGAIVLRLWDFQILQGDYFYRLSSENKVRISLIPAPRGAIYDANGETLVTNVPAYDLTVKVNDVENLPLLLKKLSYVLGISYQKLEKNLTLGHSSQYFPKLLKSNIDYEKMAVINSFADEFVGASVKLNLIRSYRYSEKTSHLLGFLNWASEAELKQAPQEKASSSQKLGKSGIEGAFNNILIGDDGGVLNEVNSIGQPIRLLQKKPPKPGLDIHLTINGQLQSFIYDTMAYKGAVVVMNANTSQILALVSNPGFDPGLYVEGFDDKEWQSMLADPDSPLNDRCLRGLYSPGSTVKPLMAYAAMDTGEITQNTVFNCPGYFRQGKSVFHCWKRNGHGNINLPNAISQSCNVYFYLLAKAIGLDKILEYFDMFGFGKKTNIDLQHEMSSLLPNPQWKKAKFKQRWLPGETINLSIGQGYISVTPLQLLSYFNVFINGGYLSTPLLLKKVTNQAGEDFSDSFDSLIKMKHKKLQINRSYLNPILLGLDLSVNDSKGTGAAARSNIIHISGKTGTTQVISRRTKQRLLQQNKELDDKYKNHGWFVGYSKLANRDKISIVVLLENSSQSTHAAVFARKILEYYQKLT